MKNDAREDSSAGEDPSGRGVAARAHLARAFGMTIRSDFAIDELSPLAADDPRTVDLDIGRVAGLRLPLPDGEPARFEFRTPSGAQEDLLHWRDVGTFRVRGQNRVDYDAAPGVRHDLLTLPLLGTVTALVLHHQGRLVLHGSAIEINGRAAVFLGDKGAGKSTTAAALVSAGRSVLTDDIVAVMRSADDRMVVSPGYAQIKLTQSATEAIRLPGARVLDRPYEGYAKHRHVFPGAFPQVPVEAAEIFILERGPALAVETLTPPDALRALMRYAYVTRYGPALFRGANARDFLQRCAEAVERTPVSRLRIPSGLPDLVRLDEFLSAHLPGTAS